MNGHIPHHDAESVDALIRTLDDLPDAALTQVRAHLDALAWHRTQHGDDPTEAPES